MPENRVAQGFASGIALTLLLIAYGLARFPSTLTASPAGWLGLIGAGTVLIVYGWIGWFWAQRADRQYPAILGTGVRLGLVIGAIFAVQMLFEYLVPITGDQDGTLALVVFGLVFLILLTSGFLGARQTGSIRLGLTAAVWSALVGSLIWYFLVLLLYYIFLDTLQEARFLVIDQTLIDFQRSGMSDLRAFILQDYLGAGFFHLTLGLIAAAIFGFAGGLAGKFSGNR